MNFNKEKCWYREACNKYNTKECYSGCIRHLEMNYLIQSSDIPPVLQYPIILKPSKLDLEAFQQLSGIKDNMISFVEAGRDLYIYSKNSGNGKTTWASRLMLKYFDGIWSGNGFECKGLFIHTPSFLLRIKAAFGKEDIKLNKLITLLSKVYLVIWDDIIVTDIKNYDYSVLLSFINIRNNYNLSNIYTSNLNGDELMEKLGERLFSRIYEKSCKIEFKGANRRGDFYYD